MFKSCIEPTCVGAWVSQSTRPAVEIAAFAQQVRAVAQYAAMTVASELPLPVPASVLVKLPPVALPPAAWPPVPRMPPVARPPLPLPPVAFVPPLA
jgi:hypothetical protein